MSRSVEGGVFFAILLRQQMYYRLTMIPVITRKEGREGEMMGEAL